MEEAKDLWKQAGVEIDPWQRQVLEAGLGIRKDGKWAHFEVGLNVCRQNGKGEILLARELAGLFIIKERLIIHSAHQFDTSLEAFRRLLIVIEDTPDLDKQVKRVSRSHGEEGIELRDGSRIRFRTRTKGGGRGFSCDCLILDEAMFIPEFTHGALLPTLSARPNSQVWYTGSAVDQMVHDDGVVFARIRERGLKGKDKSLAYFEWSSGGPDDTPENVEREQLEDKKQWARANPALGIRISPEHVGNELASMDDRTFAVERLGIGAWPLTDKSLQTIIDMELWEKLRDDNSGRGDSLCFAYDVSPARSQASISVASPRDDIFHIEVIDQHKGTGWLVDRIAELRDRWNPTAILCANSSPASSLIPQLQDKRIEVEAVGAADEARACGLFFDLVTEERLRYPQNDLLKKALKGAKARPLGDSWAWARKTSSVDITPLVAVTLALWGAIRDKPTVYEGRGVAVVGPEDGGTKTVHYVDGEAVAA